MHFDVRTQYILFIIVSKPNKVAYLHFPICCTKAWHDPMDPIDNLTQVLYQLTSNILAVQLLKLVLYLSKQLPELRPGAFCQASPGVWRARLLGILALLVRLLGHRLFSHTPPTRRVGLDARNHRISSLLAQLHS